LAGITPKGKPVSRANNHVWQKALVRVDIKDFLWHDLRHIHVLQELGGWAGLSMVLRYAHLSGEHLGNQQQIIHPPYWLFYPCSNHLNRYEAHGMCKCRSKQDAGCDRSWLCAS